MSPTTERKRIIIKRRVRALIASRGFTLDNARMHKLTNACVHTLGDEGVTDFDLVTLARLTSRGLFDRFTLQQKESAQ